MSLTNGHEQMMLNSASGSFKGCFNSLVDRQFYRYMHPCCDHYNEMIISQIEVIQDGCDDSGFASDVEVGCE